MSKYKWYVVNVQTISIDSGWEHVSDANDRALALVDEGFAPGGIKVMTQPRVGSVKLDPKDEASWVPRRSANPTDFEANARWKRLWKEAQKAAAEQGRAQDWAYVMGIFKRMRDRTGGATEGTVIKNPRFGNPKPKTRQWMEAPRQEDRTRWSVDFKIGSLDGVPHWSFMGAFDSRSEAEAWVREAASEYPRPQAMLSYYRVSPPGVRPNPGGDVPGGSGVPLTRESKPTGWFTAGFDLSPSIRAGHLVHIVSTQTKGGVLFEAVVEDRMGHHVVVDRPTSDIIGSGGGARENPGELMVVMNPADGSFGDDLDSSKAEKTFEMWHKKEPRNVTVMDTGCDGGDVMVCVGNAFDIVYRSGKWEKGNKTNDYVHTFDSKPKVWMLSRLAGEVPGARENPSKTVSQLLSRAKNADGQFAVADLAKPLSFGLDDGTDEGSEIKISSGARLYGAVDKKTVIIMDPRWKLIVISGGQMHFDERGIVK